MSARRLVPSVEVRDLRLSQKLLQVVGGLLQSGVLQAPGRGKPSRELEPPPMYGFALMVSVSEMCFKRCKAEVSEPRSELY